MTRLRTIELWLASLTVAALTLPIAALAANPAPTHPARILVARERFAMPGKVSPSIGAVLAPHSDTFAWGTAGIGVAVGIALCAAMAAAVTGTRSLRRHTLSTR